MKVLKLVAAIGLVAAVSGCSGEPLSQSESQLASQQCSNAKAPVHVEFTCGNNIGFLISACSENLRAPECDSKFMKRGDSADLLVDGQFFDKVSGQCANQTYKISGALEFCNGIVANDKVEIYEKSRFFGIPVCGCRQI